MLEYFPSPAKADLLPTDGGSSARSDPPWLRAWIKMIQHLKCDYQYAVTTVCFTLKLYSVTRLTFLDSFADF